MRKIEDYLRHAADCQQMAHNAASDDHRQMLLHMAETWEGLARDRSEQLARQKRISQLSNGDRDAAI